MSDVSSLPRNVVEYRYILLRFKNVQEKLNIKRISPPTIDLQEFKTLNGHTRLYENIIDLYIQILLLNSDKKCYAFSCEEGANIFIEKKTHINYASILQQFTYIFIPVFKPGHFTLVYVDTEMKTFSYLNSLGESQAKIESFFKTFKNFTKLEDYTISRLQHSLQTDDVNCGVFVCQYVAGFLNNEDLTKLKAPSLYRKDMKEAFLKNSDDMTEVCLHCGIDCNENVCSCCSRPSCNGCCHFYFKHYFKRHLKRNFENENFDKCLFCFAKIYS